MTEATPTQTVEDDAVVRRLYARGKWKLEGVAHFGGDETGIADMCLLLDENECPFIPGTSIAGATRSFLARQRLPWVQYQDGLAKEPPELKRLFGGADKTDTMSALIVADAHCKQAATSIRDGVRVDAKSGSAVEGAKFDVEIVERGTEFELNLECIIRHGDDSDALAELFLSLLQAFQQGDIRLGARTRRGYGRGKVESWKVRDLWMNNREDVMAWLRSDIWSCSKTPLVLRPLQSGESIFLALPGHRSKSPNTVALPPLQSDLRQYFRIEADFELRTSLLIRSSSVDPEDPDEVPDTAHLHSSEKPVVPGTSFAGAFRHRAALIANALGWCKKDEDKDAVCEMFGPIHEQKRDKVQQETKQAEPEENTQETHDEERDETQEKVLWASRVWIEEKLIRNVKPRWQNRIAIDRFTGGVVDGALFNEKPVYPRRLKDIPKGEPKYHLRLILTLEEPNDAEIGLLLLTLRDFWHGHAALGGETSNGRGTLKGLNAKLQLRCPDSPKAGVWEFSHKDERMTVEKGNKAFLECCVDQAQGYSNNPAGSRRPDTR